MVSIFPLQFVVIEQETIPIFAPHTDPRDTEMKVGIGVQLGNGLDSEMRRTKILEPPYDSTTNVYIHLSGVELGKDEPKMGF